MAQSTGDIKRRMRSIQSTQKITKAMEMVSGAKLRRATEKMMASRPYADKLEEVMGRLVQGTGDFSHPLLSTPETGKIGCIVFTADRGQAGGYNINIQRLAQGYIDGIAAEADESVVAVDAVDAADAPGDETALIVLGKKGRDYFRFRQYPMMEEYLNIGDVPSFSQAKELAKQIMDWYADGTLKEVYLFYTKFGSAIHQIPTQKRLLPLETAVEEELDVSEEIEYIFEPSAEGVLGTLLPNYVEIQVYQALLESKTSEHGARRTAMGAATDNADDMLAELTLSYNRARQAAITTELTEIVSGASALEDT